MSAALRIVTFNVLPSAYELTARWAQERGHRIALVVTSPSAGGERYGSGHRELVATAPPNQDILVSKRLRTTVLPVIAALQPDLIIAGTFPHRIPPEVTAVPRYGALNLHPAPLPRGRGPNPARLIYDGDLIAWATVHRIAPEFDAGAILSQRHKHLPEDLTEATIFTLWYELLTEALDEAVSRAVAGDPGQPQDETQATYAAPFTDEEAWLRWEEPGLTIQRRVAALNMLMPLARATIAGRDVLVEAVKARRLPAPPADPGVLVAQEDSHFTIAVADGVVDVYPRAA